MTTIIEQLTPASIVESGAHYAKVTGTFLKKDAVSLNNRFYPAETVERVVAKAKDRLSQEGGIPLQQLVKHGSMDSDESREIVGRLSDVWMDGDYAYYAAEIPNTAAGRDMATLLQGGYLNTVSLRAEPDSPVVEAGEVDGRKINIVRDFDLGGIDYTLYPGIRDAARVQSVEIYESVDPAHVRASLREEALPGAAYARSWYETFKEAAAVHELPAGSIETIQRDYAPIWEKAYRRGATQDDRAAIAHSDYAGYHQSFPIVTEQDVSDALDLAEYAAKPASVRRKIREIAGRKGYQIKETGMADKPADKTEEATPAPPALSEAGMHSHPHVHQGADYMGTYTHEHAHPHTPAEMTTHDSDNAHAHGHAAENGKPIGTSTQEAAPAATHTHTEGERLAIAVESLTKLLQAGQAPIEEAAKLTYTPAQVAEALAVLADAPAATMTEAGGMNAATKVHLQAAHDHIATALGMECCPGGVEPNNAGGDKDGAENALVKIIKGLLAERDYKSVVMLKESAQSAPPAQSVSGLAEALSKLVESQAATQKQLAALAEAVPTAARQAAEAVTRENWRPERKTHLTENRDGTAGTGSPDRTEALKERLRDKSIPIELRFKEAARALEAEAPELRLLQNLADAVDRQSQAS